MRLNLATHFQTAAGRLAGMILIPALFALASCRPGPEYQDHFTIPGNAWKSDFRPEFSFDIKDSDTASPYQLFLIIRHTADYKYQNIWVNLDSRNPGDSTWTLNRAELTLAAPNGQWLGRGLGGMYEQRVPVNTIANPAYFRRPGEYTLRLTQDMRDDPLPNVITVGVRLEKLPAAPMKAQQQQP